MGPGNGSARNQYTDAQYERFHRVNLAQPLRSGMKSDDLGIGPLFDHVRDAVVIADARTGLVVRWNLAATRLFGYTADEANGRPIEVLVPASLRARHRTGLAAYAATGHGALVDSGIPVELPARHKSGREIQVELSLTPLEGSDSARYVVAIIRDLTERKQAEAARSARAAAEEAVRIRDELLAGASHDLKNPLGVIWGQAQLLQRLVERLDADTADQFKLGLTAINDSVSRMNRMVDSMLDTVRLQLGGELPLQRGSSDLVAITRRLIEEHQATTERHQLQLVTELTELIGDWDQARIERVVDNLLSNAIKFSLAGGPIRVGLTREPEAGNDFAVLSVHDAGLGIPADDLPTIFERFQRGRNVVGKVAGTGLGLAGARLIVQQHGGSIEIESEEGAGTTVTVRLPVSAARDTDTA
jgi:PAS domain S-box-containing protein